MHKRELAHTHTCQLLCLYLNKLHINFQEFPERVLKKRVTSPLRNLSTTLKTIIFIYRKSVLNLFVEQRRFELDVGQNMFE